MHTRTEGRVDDWRTRSVADGYDGLRDLADDGFSGAVRAGGTTLFMLNGRIVGVFEGAIEDFETVDATAYVAPDPSLPLLFTMLEKGGDQRAKYYTEDTPIDEADGTLSSGSFTGYIELSENVLSGDYYVAYYGGRSMSCAFVGNREELLTGDEAFERASDEVGIYQVRDVDIEVTDVPEPAGGGNPAGTGDDGSAAGTGPANGGTESDVGSPGATDRTDAAGTPDAEPGPVDPAQSTDPTPQRSADAADEPSAPNASNTSPSAESAVPSRERSAGEGNARAAADAGPEDPDPPRTESRPRDGAGRDSTGAAGAREPATDPDPTTPDDPAGDTSAEEPASTGATGEQGPDSGPVGTRTDPEPGAGDVDPTHPTETEAVDPTHPTETEAVDVDGATPTGGVDETEAADAATAADVAAAANTDSAERSGDSVDPGSGTAVDEQATTDSVPEAASAGDEAADSGSWDADLGTGGAEADAGSGGTGADDRSPEPTVTEEREWQEARTIPALDPDRTSTGDDEPADPSRSDAAGRSGDAGSVPRQSRTTDDHDRREADDTSADAGGRSRPDEALKQEVLEREDKIDRLQQAVANLKGDRDELHEERDELRSENESLTERVTELEAEIQRLEGEVERLEGELTEAKRAAGGAPNADHRIGAAEALQGTNLFVRYASKGDATLGDAHAGDADADEVNANLRLEHHTQFESGNVAVDGRTFDEFLTGTLEFSFVDWIVGELIYEIRDTGHAGSLEDLYDAIPEVDRAELKGSVSLVYRENGDEVREQKQFDVVLRDRMGNPLVVADLNDSREPVTQSGMATLESSASRIKETNDSLSAAFAVTSSFFEPGALETAAEATSGSFLSRDSKKSFVKRSRKDGYHLCLVEARGTDFHINVPEL